MKLFNIRDFYQEKYKEYIIGSKEIEKHSVYLVYGEVPSNETRRMESDGHDVGPDEAFSFTALMDCRYVIAGTHPVPHAH